eukprot:CAMPEP_0170602306 /NCGR_PEP_ID=MMETSP0224-20130122/18319_1 /TAXON_ID=285029 /ORGANISM="Togula jolla, Strain CCCM 725" /LENGTH=44 /DNA_ID= /DNA_START= /DNA_END= /DNA_ORIENTATION=
MANAPEAPTNLNGAEELCSAGPATSASGRATPRRAEPPTLLTGP